MSYAQQWDLVKDNGFRGRVAMAIIGAAKAIMDEDPEAPNHVKRVRLARSALNNPEQMVVSFIYDIASNPTIAADGPTASADGDLDFVIASVWDARAGA